MDFSLSDEYLMVADMVRYYAETEVAPTIQEWDRKQEMAPNVLPRMAELGILSICIPECYRGTRYDYVSLGLVSELPPSAGSGVENDETCAAG